MTICFELVYSHTGFNVNSLSCYLHEDPPTLPIVFTSVTRNTLKIWWPKYDVLYVTNCLTQYESGRFYILPDSAYYFEDVYRVHYNLNNHCIVVDSLLKSTRIDESHVNEVSQLVINHSYSHVNIMPLKLKGDSIFLSNDSREIYTNAMFFWSSLTFRQHIDGERVPPRNKLPWIMPRNKTGLILKR